MTSGIMSLEAIKAKLEEFHFRMQQQELEINSSDGQSSAISSLTLPSSSNAQRSLELTGNSTNASTASTLPGTYHHARFHSVETDHPTLSTATSQHKQIFPTSTSRSLGIGADVNSRSSTMDFGADSLSGAHNFRNTTREIQDNILSDNSHAQFDRRPIELGLHSAGINGKQQAVLHGHLQKHDNSGFVSSTNPLSVHTEADITSTREFTSTQPTATFEVEDHRARMRRIETSGNSPEEWKNYIDFLKSVASSSDIRRRPLSEAYSRAFCGILNAREHRNSEVFVRLIMEYVHFKSERFEWESVDTILDMARCNVQNFAVIILASAEVKMLKGDHEKALSILTKALAKGVAQPKELLVRAIKAAEAGQTKLLSDSEQKLEAPGIFRQQGRQHISLAHSSTDPYLDQVMEHSSSVAHGLPVPQRTNNMELSQITHPPSATKAGMRHFSSTPEVRSFRVPGSRLTNSKVKSNMGMPMRVRNPLKQHAVQMFSAEKEEDTDFINSVKPLHPLHTSTGMFHSLSRISSGYHSDMTVPMEDSNHSQFQGSAHRDVFSPSISAGDRMGHTGIKIKLYTGTEKQPSTKDNRPEAPAVVVTQPPSTKDSHDMQAPQAVDSGGEKPAVATSKSPDVQSAVSAPMPTQVPVVSAGWQGAVQVMSTPSCKGLDMQPAVAPTPGEFLETVVVNGEAYHVLEKVGRGGSATVYMVFNSQKKIRALKVVDLEGAGPEVVDGYKNEISLLQRLQYCDSVIKMYNFEYNEKLNRLYVILEFGQTDLSGFFATRAKRKQGLDPDLIRFYWKEMLRAVHALHQEGIIHSDLKPANFMLVAGNLKLIDFGIANALQQDKTSVLKDSRVGTPSYMSPEAIMAAYDDGVEESVDHKENSGNNTRPKYKVGVRSDVWSLGCILYNMAYGHTPFQHIKNNMMKLQAITNPNCEIKFPAIPDAHLVDVLQKCLTRDVKSRPTTKELLDHPYLTSHSSSHGNHSTPVTKPEARRLKELLQLQMAQGSPGTQALITNLMQKLGAEKKVDASSVLP